MIKTMTYVVVREEGEIGGAINRLDTIGITDNHYEAVGIASCRFEDIINDTINCCATQDNKPIKLKSRKDKFELDVADRKVESWYAEFDDGTYLLVRILLPWNEEDLTTEWRKNERD